MMLPREVAVRRILHAFFIEISDHFVELFLPHFLKPALFAEPFDERRADGK